MARKDKAWDKLRDVTPDKAIGTRNVYEDQQLDRSSIQTKIDKGPRRIAAAVFAVFIGVACYALMTAVYWGLDMFRSWTGSTGYPSDYATQNPDDPSCWLQVASDGSRASDACYASSADVPVPDWWAQANRPVGTYVDHLGHPNVYVIGISLIGMAVFGGILYGWLMRNIDAQNLERDVSDINQWHNDQHIALPEEVVRSYDWFPDVGAHSAVAPSSIVSHVMLENKGLKHVKLRQFADKDVYEEVPAKEPTDMERMLGMQGTPAHKELVVMKGEALSDANGNPVMRDVPMIDEKFGEDLWTASGIPEDRKYASLRRRFDATKIPYNPGGKNRDRLGPYDTAADLINADWDLPDYEPQRPAGAYIVDTDPVNTMVLAITRAGKGQTYIEPMIDMWLREKRPNNIVINDPKGELLVKNYVRAARRGFQVVQFNLINPMKTDIYNPMAMASEAAREGDSTKCSLYVENIADVFFPTDGGDDPFWPNAAANAFKRAAFGLIDYYCEEERQLRRRAARENMDPAILNAKLDEMWGHVTLYNVYQFFVSLSSTKLANPMAKLQQQAKAHEWDDKPEEFKRVRALTERKAKYWPHDPKADVDLLSLYFAASQDLPRNTIRKLVANADNSLKAMGGSEKTIASVYGIALTGMSFFTDPTVSTLTSGTPSQNTDLGGLSFPRRFGVRFEPDYVTTHRLVGLQAKWSAYADPECTKSLGKDFDHEDTVSREGWARYYFDGKFPERTGYIKLDLVSPDTGLVIRAFRFRFTKGYQTTLDAKRYMTDPVTGGRIIHDGLLVELRQASDGSWKPASTMFRHDVLKPGDDRLPHPVKSVTPAIRQVSVRYSEQPKAVFLVTPPHLMKYAKLILILIKQLVDLNFDKSYMTKSNQKPLYKTRFMLDELGNLQSDGHGITGFETMLSIGLGQEQQFTLILQTLQQLRSVYGDDVDKIVQGNAQPLDAKVLTPAGYKAMRDVHVGDDVVTPKGTVTRVTGVYPRGTRHVYRVVCDDGAVARACDQHLWRVRVRIPEGYSAAV